MSIANTLRTAALVLLAGLCVPAASVAGGDDDEDAKKGVHAVRADEEIVVYGDLFARWDGTRWFIATEVHLPLGTFWRADQNYVMRVQAYQIRTILACGKDWKLSGRKYEVSCAIEDIGLQAVVNESPKYKHAQAILNEMDAKLTSARVQLQVRDNGRVTNIDIEDMPKPRNRRERDIQESIRQVLTRIVVGFDMKLRKSNFLSTGQWVENRSALLSIPSSTLSPASGLVVHQLNGYKGHIVVQTKGEGQIMEISGSQQDQEINYTAKLNGVAIYDDDEGYMTERVWSMSAQRTASTYQEYGMTGGGYAHAGMLRMLGEEEKVDVGPTREVRTPKAGRKPDLPTWEPVLPE